MSMRRYLTLAIALAPAPLAAQSDGPATGFSISARVGESSVGELAASAAGSPAFTIGHRGDRLSIGLGVGFTRLRVTDHDEFGTNVSESETTATLFQVGPDALVRVWESPSGSTLGHLALGASVGRISLRDEDRFTGVPPSESSVKGTLFGLRAGLGGEHFLDRNFSIGVEGGFQGTFATDVEEEGSSSVQGLAVSGAYAALRLSVVLGSEE